MITTRIAPRRRQPMPALRVPTQNTSVVLGRTSGVAPKASAASLALAVVPAGVSDVPMLPTQRCERPPSLKRLSALPEERRFPMTLDLSRQEVRLPFGVPRFVNAATLKAIAGAPFAQLLRKTGSAWAFVADHTRIDLTDSSQEFRLGRLTIFS